MSSDNDANFRDLLSHEMMSPSFEPSIVQSLGYTATHAQLMSVPPFAAAFVRMYNFGY